MPSTPREPLIIRPSDRAGQPTAAGGDVYATLATGDQTDGGYFLTHSMVPPGGGPPAHIHTREEEAFYLIAGELVFLVGDREVKVGAGSFVNVPKGLKHRFRNDSDEEAELLFWFTPAGIEGLFRELGAHPERIVEIGEKYGVEYFLEESPRDP